ncbi:hypothetical protein LTR85_008988 [Meristemomyces frigidus]|nr:hypothetical protein LTR85_008988 [Meristemomyces frigidus]
MAAIGPTYAPATAAVAAWPNVVRLNDRLSPTFYDLCWIPLIDAMVAGPHAYDFSIQQHRDDFNDLVDEAAFDGLTFVRALLRRWQINVFIENCSPGTHPSLLIPVPAASFIWDVRFIFDVDLSVGHHSDYDFSWGDFDDIEFHFPNLRTAQFVVQFLQDDIDKYVQATALRRTRIEGFLANVVRNFRQDYGYLRERTIALKDEQSGMLAGGGPDMRNGADLAVAVHLLANLDVSVEI